MQNADLSSEAAMHFPLGCNLRSLSYSISVSLGLEQCLKQLQKKLDEWMIEIKKKMNEWMNIPS